MAYGIEAVLFFQGVRDRVPDIVNHILDYLSDAVYLALPFLILVCLTWCGDIRKADRLGLCFALLMGTLMLSKGLFATPRPWDQNPSVHREDFSGVTGLSCPSGHATATGGAFGCLAMLYRNRRTTLVCVGLILLTTFLRIYLGMHTPYDIAVGIVLGLAVAVISVQARNWAGEDPQRDLAATACAVTFSVVAFALLFYLPTSWVADEAVVVHSEVVETVSLSLHST